MTLANTMVLVLDRDYNPVGVVPWERSVTLLWENKVQVIEEYADKTVRSVTLEIPVPSVIRFISAVRSRKRGVKFSREHVFARDKGLCQYCGRKVDRREFTYDHVTPRVSGGTTRWENIVLACATCNQKKGGRSPAQAGMKLLSTPVRPKVLPQLDKFLFEWRPGMPDTWRGWLKDQAASAVYWHGELDQD